MNFRKIIKKLASIKIAVVVILSIATITAIGTIVESRYDAVAAQKLVYGSVWMQMIMVVFAVNLIAVIIDRYPWKIHHLSFICAHVGILVLMLGQTLTSLYGLDGSLRVGIGESNRFVVIPSKTELSVYSSFDGTNYTKLFDREVDFFLNPPRADKPLEIPIDHGFIKISDYKKYVAPSRKVVETTQPRAGSAVRFQIHNDRVNVVEWLVQRNPSTVATHDFGPAQIHLGPLPAEGRGRNEIFLEPQGDGASVKYAVYKKDSLKPALQGLVQEGGIVTPGWMGLELKILRFFPKAEELWDIQTKERPNPMTVSAAKVEFQGKEHWLLLNDTLKLFTEQAVYILAYGNQRVDLGFPVKLDQFMIDRYQGTMRAAAYKSHVIVPELGGAEISMNEPLKYKGLTIYQASFEQGPKGEPTASVFSVNHDPGRWLKYLGSLIMSIGIILLFYFKKKMKKSGVSHS